MRIVDNESYQSKELNNTNEREYLVTIEVKYNCKIAGKGLAGYYIELISNISEAKWSGYTDAETMSWVADKGDSQGINLVRDDVWDIDLVQRGDEWRLPEDKEDKNVFDIDIAFIKGVLIALKKVNIKVVDTVVEDVVTVPIKETTKSMETVLIENKGSKKKAVKEDVDSCYKANQLMENLPIFDDTINISDFMNYINKKIDKHNFEFDNLRIGKIENNIKIGTYFVCDGIKDEQETETILTVTYNKRHRLYIITCTISKTKNIINDDALTFIGFIKDGSMIKGYFLPLSGVQYKDVVSLAYLKHNKYKVLQSDMKDIEFDKLNCYEFYHVVWLGDKGKHFGYMRYYINVKDLNFVLKVNTYGGCYKYSKEIR